MKHSLIALTVLLAGFVASTARANEGKGPGFRFGPHLTLSPVVNVGVFWEDRDDNDQSGAGWRVQPALSLGYTAKRSTLGLNLYYSMERGFDDDDGLDSDSFGESLSFHHTLSNKWSFSLTQSYTRSETDEFHPSFDVMKAPTIDNQKTDTFSLGAGVAYHPNERWTHSANAMWSMSKYRDRNGSDSTSASLSYMVGRQIWGGRSNWNTSLTFGLNKPESGDNSTSYTLMTGLGAPFSAKLSWHAMVGASIYNYNGLRNDTSVDPSYSIGGAWKINRRMAFSLSLGSSYGSEYSSAAAQKCYYTWNHNLTAGLNYQWSDRNSTHLNVGFSLEQHVDGAGVGGGDYDRKYFNVSLSHSYNFNAYTSLYASASYHRDMDDGRGNDDDDSDIRLDVGLSFRF